jgi:hypothetical protein
MFLWTATGKCRDSCPTGYTGIDKVCLACTDTNCLSCPGNTKVCTRCNTIMPFLKDDKCVVECGVGWFNVPGTMNCEQCNASCLTCGTNADNCLSCFPKDTLQGNDCNDKCDLNYVEINNICEQCSDINCLTCAVDKITCLSCDAGFFMKKIGIETVCVDKCETGWWLSNRTCLECEAHCELCNNSNDCLHCEAGWLLHNMDCKDKCPEGWKANVVARRCEPCADTNCARCPTDVNQCTECEDDMFLNDKGICVACTGYGLWKYVIDSVKNRGECRTCLTECKVCTNGTDCSICNEPYFLQVLAGVYTCQTACDVGYTADENRVCKKCIPTNCDHCDNANLGVCTDCAPGFHLLNGNCVECCGETYWLDKTIDTCLPCQDDHCLVCNPGNVCERCDTNYLVHEDKCVGECPTGFYTPDGLRCVTCGINGCDKCHYSVEKASVICDNCSFLNLWENTCIDCPRGTYADNGKCKTCGPLCAHCENGDFCLECKVVNGVQYFLQHSDFQNGGRCVDSCDVGYTQTNETPFRCVKCMDDYAEKCEPDDPIVSVSCVTPYKLYNSKCIMCNTITNLYIDGTSCAECPGECATCNNPADCITCTGNFVLQGAVCQTQCNAGWVPNAAGVCIQCADSVHCKKCNPLNVNQCIDCYPDYKLAQNQTPQFGTCIANCPSGFFSKVRNPGPHMDCVRCLTDCVDCDNALTCKQCIIGKVVSFDLKSCVPTCADGEIAENGVCVKCLNNRCLRCQDTTSNTCVSCYPLGNFPVFHNGECIATCPAPFYEKTIAGVRTCTRCPTNCTACTGPDFCTSCKVDFYINNPNQDLDLAECVNACPSHTVEVSGVCMPCNDGDCKFCATDLTTCNECTNGKFLYGKTCVPQCPSGYRGEGNVCVACTPHCRSCTAEKCLVCDYDFYFKENDVAQNCVPCTDCKYTIVNDTCKRCKSNDCASCAFGDDQTCVKCAVGYFLHEGQCSTTCPEGYFIRSGQCVRCGDNCGKCERNGNGVSCLSCETGFSLKLGTCIAGDCGVGFVLAPMEGKCKPCMQGNCNRCDASNQLQCLDCQQPFMLYNGLCLSKCPTATFYVDSECVTCPEECIECGGSQCLRCKSGLLLKNGNCVKACGEKSYLSGEECHACPDDHCKTCPSGTCKECLSGFVLDLATGSCVNVTSCPAHFFGDSQSGTCVRCQPSCDSCSSYDKCTKCNANLFLHNDKCIPTCPDGMTDVQGICRACVDSRCRRCASEDANVCQICTSPFVRHGDVCIEKCAVGEYLETIQGVRTCKVCGPFCSTCLGPNACLTCKADLIFSNGSCESTCPVGHGLYHDKCLACEDASCSMCDSTLTNCLVCKDGYPLFDGQCSTGCINGFFEKQNSCLQCSHACKTCDNETDCNTCKNGYFLFGKSCLQNCPTGYFGDCETNKCELCDSACATCNGDTNNDCISCAANFFRSKHTSCVATCEVGTYADVPTESCLRCPIDFCTECSNKTTCSKCAHGFVLKGTNTECVEERNPVQIFRDTRYFSPYTFAHSHDKEIFSFEHDILDAKAVLSSYVTFSHWFRGLKSSLINAGAFEFVIWKTHSAVRPPIQNIEFVIKSYDGISQTCELRSHADSQAYVLSTIPCGEADIVNWSFWVISVIKNISGKADLKVTVRKPSNAQSGYEEKVFTSTIPFTYNIITKDTFIEYNNAKIGDAYEIFNSYIMDYEPNPANINEIWKVKPDRCDYGCKSCKDNVCQLCLNNQPPTLARNGICNPVSFPVQTGHLMFDGGFRYNIDRTNAATHFASDEWGFQTWFFIDAPAESYNSRLVNLFTFHHDKIFIAGQTVAQLTMTVLDGYLSVNGVKQDGVRLRANHWYGINYRVSETEQIVQIVRQDMTSEQASVTTALTQTKNFMRVYDDLNIWVGQNYQTNATNEGAIFNFSFFPNRPPTNMVDFFQNPVASNCLKYAKDLSCYECNDGYKLSAEGCVSTIIGEVFTLQSKFSLWSRDSKSFPLGANLHSNTFSLTFFHRKKTHSVALGTRYNLFSVNGNAIIEAENVANYHTKYTFLGSDLPAISQDYSEANYDWSLFIVTFTNNAGNWAISTTWRSGNDVKTVSGSLPLTGDFTFTWGDDAALEINAEIAYANYYPNLLNAEAISRVLANVPKDCSPSCLDCNYDSGFCRNCAIGGYAGDTCKMYMKGFKFAYIYGVSDVTSLSNPSNWVFNLSDHFTKDVSSGSYSAIGYFKVYDVNALKAQTGNYIFFRVANTNIPNNNENPGKSLITFQANVSGDAIDYNFVVSQNETEQVVTVTGLQLHSDMWYLIYVAIDHESKTLNYIIMCDKEGKKWSTETGAVALAHYPERLQETGSLKLFGVDSNLSTENKVANGQFHNFYLNIDLGWKMDIFEQYKLAVEAPSTPICNDHCTRCVGVDSTNTARNICAACADNYTLNSDDQCIQNTDLFDYGYFALVEGHLTSPKKFVIDDTCFLENYRATIGFYLRKNYQPESPETLRKFLTWGNLEIGIKSTASIDTIVFNIGGETLSLENFVGNGQWNYLSFRILQGKLTAQLLTPMGDIAAQQSLVFGDTWSKVSAITIDHLQSLIGIYSVNYFATSFLGAKLVEQPNFECSLDCIKCTDRGYCKQCINGPSNVDGTCPANPVKFYNTRVSNAVAAPLHFPLSEFLPDSSIYRSKRFSFVFSYVPGVVQGKQTVFRLNNLDHNSSEDNGVANNHLAVFYESPKKFYIRYHNRIINLQLGAPKEFAVELNGEPENPEFYIAITFDGASNRFGGLIYNSPNSWSKFGFTCIGDMDFLTNHTYLHLSSANVASAEYRDIKFYYEHVLSVEYLWMLAQNSIKQIQYDCRFGSIRACTDCRTGLNVNGQCVNGATTDLHGPANQVINVNGPLTLTNTLFTKTSLNGFTTSFWFRRNSNRADVFGVLEIKSGVDTLYRLVVDRDNLIGIGMANDNDNIVVLSNLIDSRESYSQWLYVTVVYDFVRNINQVHTYIPSTKRSNSHFNRGNTGFVRNVTAGITYSLGWTNVELRATSSPNYSIASFTFTHDLIINQADIYRFITVEPKACSSPCKVACTLDGICPTEQRILNGINLNTNFDGLTAVNIAALPAFRMIKDFIPQFDTAIEVNSFLVSLNFVTSQLLANSNSANNNIILVVSNHYDIVNLNREAVIPAEIYKKAILSITHEDGNLVFYSGYNHSDADTDKLIVSFGTKKVTDFAQFSIAFLYDFTAQTIKFNIWADDLNVSKEMTLGCVQDFVTASTGFYLHEASREAHCSCHDPRFDRDFTTALRQSTTWREVSNVCNPRGITICSKCVFLQGESKTTCIQCANGFTNILGNCMPEKKCADWITLQEYHDISGVSAHGDNDSDSDEMQPRA